MFPVSAPACKPAAVPPVAVPLSQRLAAFHEDQARYHLRMAREHAKRGHDEAAERHREAAEAHRQAKAAPLDKQAPQAAMRAAAIADEASQRVGVRPLLPWPGLGGPAT